MSANGVSVKIEKGMLSVVLPVNKQLPLSSSGKTQIVASTHGNINTGLVVDGKVVHLGLNAYVFPQKRGD